jgi:hypothetical protein
MNGGILLDVFDTMYISVAVYGVAIAFAVLAVLVPDAGTARRLSLPSVSPLWLLVPVIVAAGLLATGRAGLLVMTTAGNTLPVFFLAQLVISAWVLWSYRRFPWFVVPLAVVSGWIQWSFVLDALVRG